MTQLFRSRPMTTGDKIRMGLVMGLIVVLAYLFAAPGGGDEPTEPQSAPVAVELETQSDCTYIGGRGSWCNGADDSTEDYLRNGAVVVGGCAAGALNGGGPWGCAAGSWAAMFGIWIKSIGG